MPSAIIFDLDGTLLDTAPDFTLLLEHMLQEHGRPAVEANALHATVSSGARAMVKLGFGLQDEDPALPALLEEFLQRYAAQIPQTRARLFADIDRLLAALQDSKLPWGIMTNKARRFSEPLLQHFAAFDSCGSLVCPDDVNAGKPDPAGILRVCSELQAAPEQALYIGDHPRDIEAAQRAGMPGIAVRWGYLPADPQIEHWGADWIADHPQALADYIRNQL
jgi:2-phosphoglycolate phosphatase